MDKIKLITEKLILSEDFIEEPNAEAEEVSADLPDVMLDAPLEPVEDVPVPNEVILSNAVTSMLNEIIQAKFAAIDNCKSIIATLDYEKPANNEEIIAIINSIIDEDTIIIGMLNKAVELADENVKDLISQGEDKAETILAGEEAPVEEECLENLTESVDKVQAILNKYYVSKEDAENKLGKEYIRALKKDERLPNKFRFLSGTDKSGIVEYEGKKYYWTLEKGNIKVSVYESLEKDGNIKKAKVPNYDWCKSEEQLNDRIKDLDKGESIMWNGFVIYNRNGNEYEYYHNSMEVMKSKSSEEVANYVFNFEYKKY